jgi:hypothetical protein
MRRIEDETIGWQTEFFLLIPTDPSITAVVEREASLGVTP